jgi:hypothetical protein
MCELGAIWMESKEFIPVLVPPVDFQQLKAVLQGVESRRILEEKDLNKIRDETIRILALAHPRGTGHWQIKSKKFVQDAGEVIGKLPKSSNVPRSQLEKVEKERDGFLDELQKSIAEAERIQVLNRELMAVKDAKAVAAIKKKLSLSTRESLSDPTALTVNTGQTSKRPFMTASFMRMMRWVRVIFRSRQTKNTRK